MKYNFLRKKSLEEIAQKFIYTQNVKKGIIQDKLYCGFLEYYEDYFKKFRDEKFTLVELGVDEGKSLLLWKEYFKKANIVGIDKNNINLNEKRITIIQADVNKINFESILKPYKNTISIIIDDCAHSWWQQRHCYEKLFPLLKSKGYYIVEDTFFGKKGNLNYDIPEEFLTENQSFVQYSASNISYLSFPVLRREMINKFSKQKVPISDIAMISFIPGGVIYKKL